MPSSTNINKATRWFREDVENHASKKSQVYLPWNQPTSLHLKKKYEKHRLPRSDFSRFLIGWPKCCWKNSPFGRDHSGLCHCGWYSRQMFAQQWHGTSNASSESVANDGYVHFDPIFPLFPRCLILWISMFFQMGTKPLQQITLRRRLAYDAPSHTVQPYDYPSNDEW